MTVKPSVVVLIFVLVLASPVSAEFYRYVDQHGNVIYTDDLSKVPEDQRNNVRQYENSPETVKPETTEDATVSQPETRIATDALEKERSRLQDQEKALNQEYKELMKMRQDLNEERNKAVTNAQREGYNKQIVEFNARLQDYEKKRDAFAGEIEAFNKQVEEHSKETQKQ